MGRGSIGAIVAVGVLAACSPSSSDSAETLPPLAASAAPITAAPTSAAPTTAAPTTVPPTTVVFDAVGISAAFGSATVRVVADQCGASSGSGVVVDDRHVVTSRAAIDGDATPSVVLRDGRTITTTLIGQATDVDVAVLRAEPGTFTSAATWGDSATVVEGATLTLVGYPDPGDYDVLDLRVRSVFDDGTGFRLDQALDPGQDGAPAFDARGTVVGIASSLTAAGTDRDGVVAPAARVAAAAAAIVAAPTAPQTTCAGGQPSTPVTAAPTTTDASASTSTEPGATSTSTSGTSTTSTSLPGPGTGLEAKGTWIMQLASSKASVATPAAIAAQVAQFSKIVDGVRTLRSNDWPKAYPTPDLVVFYVGGFADKAAVVARCESLGLTVPDECLARFLDG